GTACGSPIFPSAIQTLRRRPRLFVRLIGLRLKRSRNCSSVSESKGSSSGLLPTAERGRNSSWERKLSFVVVSFVLDVVVLLWIFVIGIFCVPVLSCIPNRRSASLLTGQTSWQMSQPKIRFPINGRNSRGMLPRNSIVRNEIQRVLSNS